MNNRLLPQLAKTDFTNINSKRNTPKQNCFLNQFFLPIITTKKPKKYNKIKLGIFSTY